MINKLAKSIKPSITLSITSKAKALKKQGVDVVAFSAGEPDFNTPIHIIDAAKKAMDNGYTKYTAASGMLELKQAIANEMSKKRMDYEPKQIVVSNGAKHSLYNAMQTVLEKDDEVLIPMPYWVSYPELVKLADGVPVFVESGDDFLVTIDKLKEKLTDKSKAIIITNPSNPTGALYNKDQLGKIAQFCIENDLIVISDEIYDKLVYDSVQPLSIASLDGMNQRTIVINGVSKAYAMTGWRIGWAAAPSDTAKAMGALQSHATSNPNTIAQYAALEALTGEKTNAYVEDMRLEFKRRRDYMINRVDKIKYIEYVKPKGAFYLMVNISSVYGQRYKGKKILGSLDFADVLLEEKHVAVIPGVAFGVDDYIRLSYATSVENIKKGMDKLEELITDLINQ